MSKTENNYFKDLVAKIGLKKAMKQAMNFKSVEIAGPVLYLAVLYSVF